MSRDGVEIETLLLRKMNIRRCTGCLACEEGGRGREGVCKLKDDMVDVYPKILAADTIILATPVYYYNVTAQMKGFSDRNYFIYKHGQKYQAETVGIIVVAEQEGIEDTLHTLRQTVDEFEV